MYVATRSFTLNGALYVSGAQVEVGAISPRTIARLVANRRLIHATGIAAPRGEKLSARGASKVN